MNEWTRHEGMSNKIGIDFSELELNFSDHSEEILGFYEWNCCQVPFIARVLLQHSCYCKNFSVWKDKETFFLKVLIGIIAVGLISLGGSHAFTWGKGRLGRWCISISPTDACFIKWRAKQSRGSLCFTNTDINKLELQSYFCHCCPGNPGKDS